MLSNPNDAIFFKYSSSDFLKLVILITNFQNKMTVTSSKFMNLKYEIHTEYAKFISISLCNI